MSKAIVPNRTDAEDRPESPSAHQPAPAIAYGPAFELAVAYQSPADYLQQAVERLPQGELISLQPQGVCTRHTYAQIWQQATCYLRGLRDHSLVTGDCVVLLLEHCEDFVTALWSCLLGGIVPIPVKAATIPDLERLNTQLQSILALVEQPVFITTYEISRSLNSRSLLAQLKVVYLEEIGSLSPDTQFHHSTPDALSALFLSSGTTGQPKLVSLSAQTVVNRLLSSQSHSPEAITSLNWLPLDHASANLRLANPDVQRKICLPTDYFLRDPLCWLDSLERYAVTQANITNFGMALVTRAVTTAPERRWDLSALCNLGIGAEAISPQTYHAFINCLKPFGLRPAFVFTGYGMTECGTIVSGRFCLPSLETSASVEAADDKMASKTTEASQFLSVGSPNRGFAVRIVDDQSQLLAEGERGQVQVRGPATATGYYGKAEASQRLFTADGWLQTGDIGFMREGCLVLTGRSKDIIIINAKNYACQQIEQIVEAVAGVEPAFTTACAVRQSDSVTDELAVFFCTVLSEVETVQLQQRIRAALAMQLGITPAYLIPITKADIPRTALGKVKRSVLADRLAAGNFSTQLQRLSQLAEDLRQTDFTAPQTPLEKTLAAIWSTVLQQPSIGLRDNFFELGGQSLLAVQAAVAVEQQLGIQLPLATFLRAPTVQAMAAVIEQNDWQQFWQPLVPIQLAVKTAERRAPLFCVHGGGFNVLIYRALAVQLGADQSVYGLQARGLKGGFVSARVGEMAADYLQLIRTLQPQGPYCLAGLSNGGQIAFEMARQLQQQGESVALLAVFDSYAPGGLTLLPLAQRAYSVVSYGLRYMLPRLLRRRWRWLRPHTIASYPANSTTIEPAPLAKAATEAGLAADSSDSLLTHLVQRLHLLALKRSPWEFLHDKVKQGQLPRSQPANELSAQPVDGPIIVFYAAERPPGLATEPTLGWHRLTNQGVETHEIPGHHTSIMTSPRLAKTLRCYLDRCQARQT
ncbi:MAG: AMP-binding protein [Leptolyngbya sp. SIO4C1]|nr:AMP-binding protein [Leptolyngbya sp. SIO4C1]